MELKWISVLVIFLISLHIVRREYKGYKRLKDKSKRYD
jgi:hypothetical protein